MAEDDLTSRTILKAMLSRWGFEPVPVNDGHAAWAMLRQPDAPRLVILDWNMPLVSGIDVIRKMRGDDRFKKIPVLMISTESEEDRIQEAIRAGAQGYLTKPFTADQLTDAIHQVLEKH